MERFKRALLSFYLRVSSAFSKNGPLDNVFIATTQKAGSQWLRAIMKDPRVIQVTGLREFPQRRYEWGEFVRSFPKKTVIPGLYISFELYDEIIKPNNYKTIYVIRDPRDIVVSWYFSMLKSHVLMGKVGKYRSILKNLSFDEGIHFCIDALTIKFAQMRSWAINCDDPNVKIYRFEDIIESPASSLKDIFLHFGIEIEDRLVTDILNDYSKEKMRERDLNKRKNSMESHYRKLSSSHKDAFTAEHYDHFYRVTGDLVKCFGYSENDNFD